VRTKIGLPIGASPIGAEMAAGRYFSRWRRIFFTVCGCRMGRPARPDNRWWNARCRRDRSAASRQIIDRLGERLARRVELKMVTTFARFRPPHHVRIVENPIPAASWPKHCRHGRRCQLGRARMSRMRDSRTSPGFGFSDSPKPARSRDARRCLARARMNGGLRFGAGSAPRHQPCCSRSSERRFRARVARDQSARLIVHWRMIEVSVSDGGARSPDAKFKREAQTFLC